MPDYDLVNRRNIIEGIGAAIGLLPVSRATYIEQTEAEKEAIRLALDKRDGPTPYISWAREASAFGRSICRVTNSVAYHAGLYVPKRWATRVRNNHPELARERRIPGSIEVAGRAKFCEWIPPVPQGVCGPEIIESQKYIAINDWRAVTREGEQLVFFARDWTPAQADAICYAAYYLFGLFYDVMEIGAWLSWLIPNDSAYYVCSSYIVKTLTGRMPTEPNGEVRGDMELEAALKNRGINPGKASPADLGRFLFSHHIYTPFAVQCDAEEVRDKI